jgi:hypothetical protein
VDSATFKVILESVDPTGIVVDSDVWDVSISHHSSYGRFYITIGECMYRIDNKGLILDRIIPHEDVKK